MPPTVSVASFVFGVVFLLAALVGKDLKLVTVELPALGPGRRLLLGSFGLALTMFGLLDGQRLVVGSPISPSPVTSQALSIRTPSAAAIVATKMMPIATAGERVLPCLADVLETDLVILPMEAARRTDSKWGHGQPRAGVMAMQFEDPTGIRGGVKFATVASGAGVDILGVFDATCQPVTTYTNESNPTQPKDHPYAYETMRYQFGEVVYAADLGYGEGNGLISVRAQQVDP